MKKFEATNIQILSRIANEERQGNDYSGPAISGYVMEQADY
jgi:hypothetical protein